MGRSFLSTLRWAKEHLLPNDLRKKEGKISIQAISLFEKILEYFESFKALCFATLRRCFWLQKYVEINE